MEELIRYKHAVVIFRKFYYHDRNDTFQKKEERLKACPIVPAFCIICYWYKLHLFPHKVALCWYIFEGDCHSVRNNLRNSDIDFCGNCYDFDYYGNCYYFD